MTWFISYNRECVQILEKGHTYLHIFVSFLRSSLKFFINLTLYSFENDNGPYKRFINNLWDLYLMDLVFWSVTQRSISEIYFHNKTHPLLKFTTQLGFKSIDWAKNTKDKHMRCLYLIYMSLFI